MASPVKSALKECEKVPGGKTLKFHSEQLLVRDLLFNHDFAGATSWTSNFMLMFFVEQTMSVSVKCFATCLAT